VPPCRRLYFIVPDGADSVLTAVQQNLTQLREAEAGALSPHLQPTPGLHDLSQEMRGIDDPAVALPRRRSRRCRRRRRRSFRRTCSTWSPTV
jgi:hypothetical protein